MTDGTVRMGQALRAGLFYREMTPEVLATSIGRSVEQVRRWTRGEYGLKAEAVVAIADALDLPTDLFLRPPETREEALALCTEWDARTRSRARA